MQFSPCRQIVPRATIPPRPASNAKKNRPCERTRRLPHSEKHNGTGPVPDNSKFLAGYLETNRLPDYKSFQNSPWVLFTGDLTAVVGSWGVRFAKNLTPDPETGIGSWTEDMFVQTIRTQKRMGVGRTILPPMGPIFAGNLSTLAGEE